MIKTLLALAGAVLLAATSLHAQNHRVAVASGRPVLARGSYGGHHGGYSYSGRHHGGYGRYYYYGGVPYFLPFYGYGYGFGYPGYYGGFYGDGFAGPYGYGGGEDSGVYEGRITHSDQDTSRNSPNSDGPSLPEAVQRQLAKKGYYKGSVDGQFGPASRSALSRFQREHDLKQTGRIDEATLDALGFTDHR